MHAKQEKKCRMIKLITAESQILLLLASSESAWQNLHYCLNIMGSAPGSVDSFIIANSQLFIIIIVLRRMTVTPCRCVPRALYF